MRNRIRKSLALYSSVLLSFMLIAVFSSVVLNDTKDSDNEILYLKQNVHAVDLNRNFTFSGEGLPRDNLI
jgi:hypothetical protein